MVRERELLAVVDAAFERTAAGLRRWDDPHADRDPTEDEYSRCLDPAKYRLLVARAEAWAHAVEQLGLADVERVATVRWAREHGNATAWDAVDVLRPRVDGRVPVVLAHRSFGGCAEPNSVTVGAGVPAVEIRGAPGCGCDACDHGSELALAALDDAILGVVTGGLRYLWRDDESILVTQVGRSTTNIVDDDQIEAALADPSGWSEVQGSGWLSS